MKIFNKKPIIARNLIGEKISAVHLDLDIEGNHRMFIHYNDNEDIDHFGYNSKKDAMHDFEILTRGIK